MVRHLVQSARRQRAQQVWTSRRRPVRSTSRRGQNQLIPFPARIHLLQDVAEALRRLPREVTDARLQRLKRATDLSMKHIYLSPEMQAKQTPFEPYLQVGVQQLDITLKLCSGDAGADQEREQRTQQCGIHGQESTLSALENSSWIRWRLLAKVLPFEESLV